MPKVEVTQADDDMDEETEDDSEEESEEDSNELRYVEFFPNV